MALTPEQEGKFDYWLDSRKIKNKCPICKKIGFSREDWKIKYMPLVDHITDPHDQTARYISMTCSNCGYVVHFAADKILL